jgi:hypothetical protein
VNSVAPDDPTNQAPPARICAELLIYSDSLPPAEVSRQLGGLEATSSALKGPKLGSHSGMSMNVPRHMWQLSTESHVESNEVNTHLSWLLARLLPLQAELEAMRVKDSAELRVVAHVWTSGTSAHVLLTKPTLDALLALNLELHLEFADYGEED